MLVLSLGACKKMKRGKRRWGANRFRLEWSQLLNRLFISWGDALVRFLRSFLQKRSGRGITIIEWTHFYYFHRRHASLGPATDEAHIWSGSMSEYQASQLEKSTYITLKWKSVGILNVLVLEVVEVNFCQVSIVGDGIVRSQPVVVHSGGGAVRWNMVRITVQARSGRKTHDINISVSCLASDSRDGYLVLLTSPSLSAWLSPAL